MGWNEQPEQPTDPAWDPMELITEGMHPLPEMTTDETDRLHAAVDVIGRTGAKDFEVGFDDEAPTNACWYARCDVVGVGNTSVAGITDPASAAEKLARKLINGGTCSHCGRTMTLVIWIKPGEDALYPAQCHWRRTRKRWERGCLDLIEEGKRLRVVQELYGDRLAEALGLAKP